MCFSFKSNTGKKLTLEQELFLKQIELQLGSMRYNMQRMRILLQSMPQFTHRVNVVSQRLGDLVFVVDVFKEDVSSPQKRRSVVSSSSSVSIEIGLLNLQMEREA
jgi:hypothetical protein